MEFILNNQKYSIVNHELLINYLIVDSYFNDYSKYDYNITFNFLKDILAKDKITFKDIINGANDLEELIENGEINFIPYGLEIQQSDDNFNITYQNLEFGNINIGEAVPLLITLYSLLNAKPTVTLIQIKEELDYFLEKFRSYPH